VYEIGPFRCIYIYIGGKTFIFIHRGFLFHPPEIGQGVRFYG